MDRNEAAGSVEPQQRRASAGTSVLVAALLGLAEVLEPRPERDLGAEVQDAPSNEPELELSFGSLGTIEQPI